MGQDIVYPNNTIIVEDNGLIIEEFEVGANATPAKMLPGNWVIYDTLAGDIKEAGAKAHGVIGLLIEKPDGALTDTYAVGDQARVITGGNGKVMVRREASSWKHRSRNSPGYSGRWPNYSTSSGRRWNTRRRHRSRRSNTRGLNSNS